MTRLLARCLTRLYPRRWTERYGVEFEAMLEMQDFRIHTLSNVIGSALWQRAWATEGVSMNLTTFPQVVKKPRGFLPIVMSLAALAICLGDISLHSVVRGGDEGTVAHLWQLLMAGQLPLLLFFAVKWLPKAPKAILIVIGLQAGAALASMAPAFFLGL